MNRAGEEFSLQRRIGRRIRELRLARRNSQDDLARRATLDRTYLSGVENGRRNLSMATLARIAAALRISLQSFFASDLFAAIEPSKATEPAASPDRGETAGR